MIIRLVAMKDASTVGTSCACTGAGQGTVKDFGGRSCGIAVYAGLELLSSTTGGIKALLQANSSSGYSAGNPGTDIYAFSSQACRDSQWAYLTWNCASATSTDRRFYRAAWSQTCGDVNKWLLGLAVDPITF